MELVPGQDVLLFFQDRDTDTFVRGDRHLRTALRKHTYFLRPGKQRISGFELSFRLLCKALKRSGRRVHVNKYQLAKNNPHYPVGICGYPHILEDWKLPNPALLGPGMFDHPRQAPHLFQDQRFNAYIAFCEWMRSMFAETYGLDRLYLWYGGIDLDEWTATPLEQKTIDLLVYDKIRWNRDTLVPGLRDPVVAELKLRGLSIETVRYGEYTHEEYRKMLARSRAMVFLCEHETQGMAYQEAMACGLPILAWDQGYWLDPNRPKWSDTPVKASSVPYFAAACGERFVGRDDFPFALDRFIERIDTYRPREYVRTHLSFEKSAEQYLEAYRSVGTNAAPVSQLWLSATGTGTGPGTARVGPANGNDCSP